jgi:hypothetical protein
MEGEYWMEIRNDRLKGFKLHRNREEIPHRPANGEEVRGIAAETGVHADRAESNEANGVTAACNQIQLSLVRPSPS